MNDIARMPARVGYELLIHYADGGVEPVELLGADEQGARVEAENLYYGSVWIAAVEWSPLSGETYPCGSVGFASQVREVA